MAGTENRKPAGEDRTLQFSRFAIERAADAVFWLDGEGRFVHVNDAACASLGYTREEFLGRRAGEICIDFPEEDWSRLWARILEEGSLRFESRHRRKDGSVFPVEISCNHVEYAGKPYNCAFARDITERKRAERALQESEERYRALYEDNPSMYFTVDREGTVLSVNRFGAEQLGYRPEDLVGRPVVRVFHPDDVEAVRSQLAECLRRPGSVVKWEFRKVRKDGSVLWVHEDVRTVRGRDGEPLVLIVCEDITEQKRMEEALRRAHDELEERIRERTADLLQANEAFRKEIVKREEAEASLRHERDLLHILLDTLPENIFFKDAEGRHTRVSRTLARFFGLGSPEEAVGKTDFDFYPAEEAARFRRLEQEILRSGRGFTDRVERSVSPGGEVRYFSTTKCPVRDSQGRITGIIGVSRDITESKRSEKRFRSLLDSAPDAMVIVDPRGRIVLVNARTLDLFGYEREELLDRPFETLFPPRYHEGQPIQRGIPSPPLGAGPHPSEVPLYARRRDGSEFPVEMSLSPIETEDGRLHANAIRDVTERKELERQIADLSDQEQRRIGQELHDSLGQQMTGLAMLAKGVQQELRARGAPEAARMDDLLDGVRQAQGAVRNLSRGLLPVDLEAGGLVRALETLVGRSRDLHGIDCSLECDARVPVEDAFTANHLYRIAQEAIHNAVKHGQARRIVVSVRADQGGATLRIRDDGIGISGDPGTSGGMGIRIMRYRAGLVGAALDIESEGGRGTAVTCTLVQSPSSGAPAGKS